MDEITQDVAAAARKGYYAEARSWSIDKVEELLRSRRTAWIITGAVICIAVAEALALIALLPLKTVVPYTIMVDRNTGFAQVLEGNAMPTVKPQSALTQSLLAQYVVARETYDINSIQGQYRKVALWSAENAKRAYLALMPAGNPESPVNRYGKSTVVEAHIESVTPMSQDTALVRFYTDKRAQGQPAGSRSYWVSLIRFRFAGEPMSIEDRLVNPLGFQVFQYRRDQEAPPAQENTNSQIAATNSASVPAAEALRADPSIPVGEQGGASLP